MKKIEVVEYILPAYLAPYLINDDPSGLEDEEIGAFDAWYDREKPGYCAGVKEDEPFFTYSNDFNRLGTGCYTYQFIKD